MAEIHPDNAPNVDKLKRLRVINLLTGVFKLVNKTAAASSFSKSLESSC